MPEFFFNQIRLSCPPCLLVLMLRILSCRWGSKRWTFPESQSFSFGRKREATLMNSDSLVGGPMGASQAEVERQGSFQTLTSSPLPIAQSTWFLIRSLPIRIPFQPWEQLDRDEVWRKSISGNYFPRSTRATRQSGDTRVFQLSFTSIASLKHCMPINPRPPSSLDLIIVFQDTHDIFLSSGLASHQKRVKTDWILLQRETGSLKQLILWLGIDERTLLRSVSFPAADNCLEDQLMALCRILSTMPVKVSLFFLPTCSGRPRYLPVPPSV